jgi:hypothetical protein
MTVSTEEIVRLYAEEKLSIRSIASRLRINRETIKRRLKLAHVEKRTRSEVYALRPYNRPRHVTPIEAFWKKVDKNGPIQPHCTKARACWVWIGGTSRGRSGYVGQQLDALRGPSSPQLPGQHKLGRIMQPINARWPGNLVPSKLWSISINSRSQITTCW